jgi:predicted deacylase
LARSRARNAEIKIAGQTVAPGERCRFDLESPNLYTNTPLGLPVEIIHGRYSGPTLMVCAAIHGDELNGVEIIRRLSGFRNIDRLHGTLVLVPAVNIFGFIHQSRYLPDRRDLNRCFPGSERGSLASRVAYQFFSELVVHCTHIIDLHTAAVHRHNLPQIRAALDDPEVASMANAFSIPVIINAGLIDKSLRYEAGKRGIPVITYEAGEALRLDEHSIVTGVRGIVSVMRSLNMLPSKRIGTVPAEPSVASSSAWTRAPVDGVFRPLVDLGARVAPGDSLGVITSPFDADESILVADADGIIICVNNLPLVYEGDALFHVARFGAPGAVEDEIAEHESNIEEDRLFGIESMRDPS